MTTKQFFAFEPDWVCCPGETLEEWFTETNVPRSCAKLYGITPEVLTRILDGVEPIDEELAARLAALTQAPRRFWLAMEHNYRAGLAKGLSHPHEQ